MDKDFGNKLPYELLPFKGVDEIVRVLQFGAGKHGLDSWKKFRDKLGLFIGAALRHISKFTQGEEFDRETGLSHIAHAACNLLFILDLTLYEGEINGGETKKSDTKKNSGYKNINSSEYGTVCTTNFSAQQDCYCFREK